MCKINLILLIIALFLFTSNTNKAIEQSYDTKFFISDLIANSIEFQMLNAETFEVIIETFDGTGFSITWNDTTIISVNSSEEISHTFSIPYSGKVRFEGLNGMQIKSMVIGGGFAFDIQQLYSFTPRLESLIMNAGIQCYGDIADKPKSLVYLDFQTGSFYGNFNKERLKNVERLRVVHGNKITFNIADFDRSIKYIGVTGKNTATGLLDSLNYPLLHHFDLKGMNTVSGDLGKVNTPLPSVFYLGGNNTVNTYTSGNLSFISSPQIFILSGSKNTFSTEDVDALLIDLDNSSTKWKGSGLLILTGTHASPSSASSSACVSLELKGAKVFTNGSNHK